MASLGHKELNGKEHKELNGKEHNNCDYTQNILIKHFAQYMDSIESYNM